MPCRQFFLTSILVLTITPALCAQVNTCSKKLAEIPQLPEFRGFHLGMTQEQAKARVPQMVFEKTNNLGVSKLSINPFFDPRIDKSSFADVRTVSLDFLDGKLTSLWIGFEGTFKWPTAEEFVKGISEAAGLPNQWTTRGRVQQLKCGDFELSVTMIAGGPSLRIIDTPAEETLAARRQAKEDAATAAEANGSESHAVIGDTRNRTYYAKDCEALKSIPEKSQTPFASSEDAEKAGYKRADNCQ